MRKAREADPLSPRPSLDFSKGVRGKYFNQLQQGTNVVILDPDIVEHFPDSESVNNALRAFLAIGKEVESVSIPILRKAPRPVSKRKGTALK